MSKRGKGASTLVNFPPPLKLSPKFTTACVSKPSSTRGGESKYKLIKVSNGAVGPESNGSAPSTNMIRLDVKDARVDNCNGDVEAGKRSGIDVPLICDSRLHTMNGLLPVHVGVNKAESFSPSPTTEDIRSTLISSGNTYGQESKHLHHSPISPSSPPTSSENKHLLHDKASGTNRGATDFGYCPDDDYGDPNDPSRETFRKLVRRHTQNLIHFFVEDWFISAMLGAITAVLSISVDVSYEYLNEYRAQLFDMARAYDRRLGFLTWVAYLGVFVTAAALVCRYIAVQAIGSGIPEVKVIMNGFMLQNYLSFRTLVAKVLSLTLTLGSGLPVGKEGPFVHMGAIVGTLLSKMTKAWQSNAFFSNEGRELEILSSGCAVGIACTFSSPAGAVLYGIESTHKYFAVKNYWRSFFATTCSALIFRFANRLVIPPHIAGTITAYYQTSFPNEVFLIEEIPVFVLMGVLCGLFGALFVLLHRRVTYFRKCNRYYRVVFGRNSFAFTVCMALVVGVITHPDGIGKYVAGKYTFRETLSDFISNCTMSTIRSNLSRPVGCQRTILRKWTPYKNYGVTVDPTEAILNEGNLTTGSISDVIETLPARPRVMPSLFGYLVVNYFLVAVCITLAIPAGIFVPSFVIGACGGRIVGECMYMLFPNGLRGPNGPQIFPGLYAVVGAAAYTGAITHSLSIAVIVCETTGQLCALLPVLIALMVANAVSSFLQPSIYESIIEIKKYPHLAELPPSRMSVHTLKVEQIMVRDLVYITKQTTYKELRDLLIATEKLRSYPLVTDDEEKILLGSVARKYLSFLLTTHLGHDPGLLSVSQRRRKQAKRQRRNGTPEPHSGSQRRINTVRLNNHNHRHSPVSSINNSVLSNAARNGNSATVSGVSNTRSGACLDELTGEAVMLLNDRNVHGNTLLPVSPLHEEHKSCNNPLAPLLLMQKIATNSLTQTHRVTTAGERAAQLRRPIDLDEVAIDAAPFQLVVGTSLYKVHTLFSLLGLNHAYVTHRGRLIGVVSLRELRLALANIYTRGAVPTTYTNLFNPTGQLMRLNSKAQWVADSGWAAGDREGGGGTAHGWGSVGGVKTSAPGHHHLCASCSQATKPKPSVRHGGEQQPPRQEVEEPTTEKRKSLLESLPPPIRKLTREFLITQAETSAGDIEALPGHPMGERSSSSRSGGSSACDTCDSSIRGNDSVSLERRAAAKSLVSPIGIVPCECLAAPVVVDDDPFVEADGSGRRSKKRENSISDLVSFEREREDGGVRPCSSMGRRVMFQSSDSESGDESGNDKLRGEGR